MNYTTLTICFHNARLLGQFCAWLSDGGGEQGFNDSHDDDTWVEFDYTKCFPAWGYDPKTDGAPRIFVGFNDR